MLVKYGVGRGAGGRGSELIYFGLYVDIAQVQWNVTGEERNLTRGYFYWLACKVIHTRRKGYSKYISWANSSPVVGWRAQTEPEGDHAAEIPAARGGEHHAGCGQASAGGWGSDTAWLNHTSKLSDQTVLNEIFLILHYICVLNPFALPLLLQFMCCGSTNYSDWADSTWIKDEHNKRLVPDTCCKTPSDLCGLRDHPSNIYRVEVGGSVHLALAECWITAKLNPFHFSCCQGGCIMKLEEFILSQLYILGAVGIGIAFLQVKLVNYSAKWLIRLIWTYLFNKSSWIVNKGHFVCNVKLTRSLFLFSFFQLVGMMFTCCLYQNLKEDPSWCLIKFCKMCHIFEWICKIFYLPRSLTAQNYSHSSECC